MAMTLASAKAALARAREHKKDSEADFMGTLAASGGGVTIALVNKYLPMLIPGEAADTAAVILTDVVITGLALWSGSRGWMAYAYGALGYSSGKTIEKVLPG